MTAAASSPRSRIVDAALVLALVGIGQLDLHVGAGTGFPGTAPALLTALLVAAVPVPLFWRRRWPVGALAAVGALLVVPQAFAHVTVPLWGGFGVLVFALASAAYLATRPGNTVALVIPAVVLVGLGVLVPHFAAYGTYAFSIPVLLLGWLVGRGMRRWHRTATLLRGALDELAATERARAAAAVADERARIARELHDVVAHAVSVMVVQAGSARLGMGEDPAASAVALRHVEETGRQALVEMEHLLGLLRSGDAAPPLAPQPTLRGLGALADSARAAGQQVDLRVEGAPVPLPPGLDLSAYRIVQEGLTNAFRHAGPVPVAVHLRYGRSEIEIVVTNGPPAARAARPGRGGGHGLIGMRERVDMLGGRLDTGRTADGGFVVRAVLPLPETEPAASGQRVGGSVA